MTPREELEALCRVPLPEAVDYARRAVIVSEAGRHGATDVCERVAVLCDRVAAGESRESLRKEFSSVNIAVTASAFAQLEAESACYAAKAAVWAVLEESAALAVVWAVKAASVNGRSKEATDRMIAAIRPIVEGAIE